MNMGRAPREAAPQFEVASVSEAYREKCEDRFDVYLEYDRVVVVIADGAGGVGFGDTAAASVINGVREAACRTHSAKDWSAVLSQIDHRCAPGESTAIIADIREYGIAGASVGDSQAYCVAGKTLTDLTHNQCRKPLLGSGSAKPAMFTGPPLEGVLILATDGFWDYTKRESVCQLVSTCDFYSLPRKCIELIRLPSGDLWDDTTVVAIRPTPRPRTRRTYEIT